MHTVNLRAVGSDPEFPTRGPLIGTADIEDGPYPKLLVMWKVPFRMVYCETFAD
jgi:hypothetical protein